ncbi:hypothetical protein C8F01DRAFT_1135346 [Mycena amicta]|nr:hypothetical protein C8F01DRAFT_1135346 [Mycena amicta]
MLRLSWRTPTKVLEKNLGSQLGLLKLSGSPRFSMRALGHHAASLERKMTEEEALSRIERIETLAEVFHGVPKDSSARLSTAYLLVCEIIAYLSRHGEEAPAYISIFTNTAVAPDSDVARARKAIFKVAQLFTQILSAVPDSASIRKEHAKAFALHGALDVLFFDYNGPATGDSDSDGAIDLQEWTKFWIRAQPIVIELAGVLDESKEAFMELPADSEQVP